MDVCSYLALQVCIFVCTSPRRLWRIFTWRGMLVNLDMPVFVHFSFGSHVCKTIRNLVNYYSIPEACRPWCFHILNIPFYESSTWKLHDLCMHFQLWSFKHTFDHLMWLSLCAANCNSESHQHLMFKLLSNYDPKMQVAYLWEIFTTEMALSCLCTVRSPVFQLQFPVTVSSFSMTIFTFCTVRSLGLLTSSPEHFADYPNRFCS